VTGDPSSRQLTFVFTDIEGSTWLVQQLGADWDAVLHDHYRVLREVWHSYQGHEVSTEGDAFFVAFDRARDGVAAAVAAQVALAEHDWPAGVSIRVRIGVHTGEARPYGGDFVGLAVHEAARVQSAAHGGQILVTERTKEDADFVEGVYFIDRGLHRLKDLAVPLHLFQVAGRGLETDFPPLRTLSVMPNNFPVPVTSFVGRADDVAALCRTLGEERLVTLVGAGGVGKTRLALEVGAEVLELFPDGAWVVDLAGLSDPNLVTKATATAAGVREHATRPIVETLCDHLLGRRALIILDNCEHVIDACALLAERLITSCAGVTVLATSREALNVPGEITWRLRSLSRPDPGAPFEEASTTESVALFVQRAASGRQGFALTLHNYEAISQICRRLDGVPLAVELAAARVRGMPVHELADRLDDRFRLLIGGSRTALPRQRTLEATVAWSYGLLSEPERLLFDRLSVFAGGFTIGAAQEVCSDDRLTASEILTTLSLLYERSMVSYEERPGGGARYGLLETLRQFGRDRLIERGESEATRDRHLRWAVRHAELASPESGATPHEGVRTEAEEDNLRAAIEWAIESKKDEAAVRIVAAVWVGHFQEQFQIFERLLPLDPTLPAELAAKVLFGAVGLAFMMGDWQLGFDRGVMAAEAGREAGDTVRASMSVTYRGLCAWGLDRDDDARDLMEAGLQEAVASSADDAEGRALCFLAWWWSEKDLEAARAYGQRAQAKTATGTLEVFTVAHIAEVRGFLRCLEGEFERAAVQLSEAIVLFKGVQINCGAHILETSAAWAAMTEHFVLGAELLGAAERIREETADRPRPWERAVRRDWLPLIPAGLDDGAYRAAVTRGRELAFAQAVDFCADSLMRHGRGSG
jgi:predicted ATPase/class 3 adenylate cyclase